MPGNIPTFSRRSITARGELWLYPRHCRDDEEFSQVQRVRGYLSGLARRARTAGRDRSIVTLRRAGMKMLALALYKGLSVASISRIVGRQKGEEAKQYPFVPEVLANLFRGVLVACHIRFVNRFNTRKVRDVEEGIERKVRRDRLIAAEIAAGRWTVGRCCPSCGLRHLQLHEMDCCASCGLRLRYDHTHQRKEDHERHRRDQAGGG